MGSSRDGGPAGWCARNLFTGGAHVVVFDGPDREWAIVDAQYGPRKRSPLKWIMWSGESATHTSVSHAISLKCFRRARRSRNAVTNTKPALLPANNSFSSTNRFGS